MLKTAIVILPVEDQARKACNLIQEQKFESRDHLDTYIKSLGVEGDIAVYGLDAFMEGVNNQEIDILSDSFISYVTLAKI